MDLAAAKRKRCGHLRGIHLSKYLYAIGYNGNAQLGTDTFLPEIRYTVIAKDVVDLECDNEYTAFSDTKKDLYVSGFGMYGQFGGEYGYSSFTKIDSGIDDFASGVYSLYTLRDGVLTSTGSEECELGENMSQSKKIAENALAVSADVSAIYTSNGNIINTNGHKIDLFSDGQQTEAENKITFDINGNLIYSIAEEAKDSVIIVACYIDGKLAYVSISDEIHSGSNMIDITRVDGAIYRIMLWNSLDGMIPLEKDRIYSPAQVSMGSGEENGIFYMELNGRTASIDGVPHGGEIITVYAFDKEAEVPTQESIRAFTQFSANSDGTFNHIVPMNTDPASCKLRIRISGEIIEK